MVTGGGGVCSQLQSTAAALCGSGGGGGVHDGSTNLSFATQIAIKKIISRVKEHSYKLPAIILRQEYKKEEINAIKIQSLSTYIYKSEVCLLIITEFMQIYIHIYITISADGRNCLATRIKKCTIGNMKKILISQKSQRKNLKLSFCFIL